MKKFFFSVLVLFVLIAQINSPSIAVAGEKASTDINNNTQDELFFKGKVINENGTPLSNIPIIFNYSNNITTDQSGNFSFPIHSAVWGVAGEEKNVTINSKYNNTNILYLSNFLMFKVFWGSDDRSYPSSKISILMYEGADQKVVVILPKDRFIIRLDAPSNVRALKRLYEQKNYKEFLKEANAFLNANENKNGIDELQQLVSEAQIKLTEEQALQKKILAEEQARKKQISEELSIAITEMKRLKENKDFVGVASSGSSYLNKYPNIQNSNLIEIQALVKDAEREIEAKRELEREKAERIRLAEAVKNKVIAAKRERQRLARRFPMCNGVILDEIEFYGNNNPYADKGKCTNITAASFQMTSATTGLFSISDSGADLVYIEFKAPFRGRFVKGVAKIKGVYTYITNNRGSNTVPRLEMIEIKRSQ